MVGASGSCRSRLVLVVVLLSFSACSSCEDGTHTTNARNAAPNNGTNATSNANNVAGSPLRFLILGAFGITVASANGADWSVGTPLAVPARALANGDGVIVAVGDGRAGASTDGVSWSFVDLPGPEVSLEDVAYADGMFVAVGTQIGDNRLLVFVSNDAGGSWSTAQVPDAPGQGSAIAAGGGNWVAVGSAGTVLRAGDPMTWQEGERAPVWLQDVAWDGAQFVAVGERGTLLTSSDGASWTPRDTGTETFFEHVMPTDHGTYVLGDFPSTLLFSDDGAQTWSQIETPTQNELGAMAYDGRFVLVGDYKPSDTDLYYSDDRGTTWEQGIADANFIDVSDVISLR